MLSASYVRAMSVFRPRKKGVRITREQALNSRPVKNDRVVEHRLETGEVLLVYPLYLKPWMAAAIRYLGGNVETARTRKLQLDPLGTSVWDLIDGRRSVNRIIQLFVDAHRVLPREAEVAVTRFLRDLGRRGLLGLQ